MDEEMENEEVIVAQSCNFSYLCYMKRRIIKFIRDGLYELRMEYNNNIYRVFFIFDDGQIVVLFNGFQKKTQKTPSGEIEKALKIKEAYYGDKQSSNR